MSLVEHHLNLVRELDWVIDIGATGGKIVGVGTPEEVAKAPRSHTDYFLKLEMGL